MVKLEMSLTPVYKGIFGYYIYSMMHYSISPPLFLDKYISRKTLKGLACLLVESDPFFPYKHAFPYNSKGKYTLAPAML